MQHFRLFSLSFTLSILCLVSCTDEPTSSDNNGNIFPGGGGQTDTGDDLDSYDIDFDYTFLTGETESIPTDESDEHYEDYVENSSFGTVINVDYDGGNASVSGLVDGVTAEVDGAHVTLTSTVKKVEISLSGTTSDGSLKIYSDNKFKLSLNNVEITNPNGAAINNQSKKRTFVVLNGENELTDGTTYLNVPEDEDLKGCFFSEGQLMFSGDGKLTVTSNYKHGLVSDDYLFFRPGNVINVSSSTGHALKSNDGVFITGGVLNLNTSATACKGISTDGDVAISGGRTTITTSGDGTYDADEQDTSSAAGIKADGNLTMIAGLLQTKSSGKGGKGVNCDGTITIDGGEVQVITTGATYYYNSTLDSKSKGIKADGDLTVNGGSIKIRATGGEGSEGMESKATLTINGGTVQIASYDDAINAKSALVINGGEVYTYASNNDAIDSNGTLTINGGIVVAVAAGAPEGAFDCDQNTFKISGGTIIGIGGETSTPTSNACTQPVILSGNQATVGTTIALTKSDGTTVMTFKVPRSYSSMLISSPLLSTGNTYNLLSGASVTGGATFHGLTTGGIASAGSTLATINVTSMVTTSNYSGQHGGGQPGGRPF